MNHAIAMKVLEVQEAFRNGREFEALWAEHQRLAGRFMVLMQELPKEQAAVIEDFFGIVNEIHLRTLAYSVSQRE